MYYISIRQRNKTDDQIRKYLWGPGIQTPSYILSPLDLEPQNKFRMPISFSPFLPFGAFGNTAGNDGVFLLIVYGAQWIPTCTGMTVCW